MTSAHVQPAAVRSCLSEDKRGMDRIMLEVVVSGCVTKPQDVGKFVQCTLLCAEQAQKAEEAAEASAEKTAWQAKVVGGCIRSLKTLNEQVRCA